MKGTSKSVAGFTLVESIVALAIIALLMALLFTASAPAREKAMQTHCIANLTQIGKAIEMYRQDCGGKDEGRYFEMGFPPNEIVLARKYLNFENFKKPLAVVTCPEVLPEMKEKMYFSYHYTVCDNEHGNTPPNNRVSPCDPGRRGFPDFPERVRRRGSELAILIDHWHNYPKTLDDPWTIIAYRLDGHVNVRRVPKSGSSWDR